jgi:hypothetical protein
LSYMCPACGHLAYFWENWKLRTAENPVLSTVLVVRVTRLELTTSWPPDARCRW